MGQSEETDLRISCVSSGTRRPGNNSLWMFANIQTLGKVPLGKVATMSVSHDEVAAWDRAHVVHPWSFAGPSLMIVKGEGSRYWDSEGREYLDALAGIQLCEVGHGRVELAEVAARQIAELEYAPMFWNFGNEQAARLAHRLAELE